VEALEYPGPASARLDALSTLADEGPSAKIYSPAVLARALVDRDAEVKKKAAEVYAIIDPGAKSDISVFEAALKNDEPAFRRMAAHTLGELGPSAKKSKSKLSSRLSDKDPYVRLAAAEAIYRIGAEDRKAISVFNDALRSEDFIYRHAAARAIRQIGPKAAPTVPALAAALNKSRTQLAEKKAYETPEMGNDRGYRALLDLPYALSKALEAIGTPDAKDALIVK
jgi:HEAT repeat protein